MQRGADVVKAVRGAVLRKLLLQIGVDAQQVVESVLVLGPVEAPQDHPSLRGALGIGRCHLAVDPAGEGQHLFHRRARFLLRGHLAGLDLLQHGQPAFPAALAGKVRRELVQVELPFRLVAAVTFLAVLDEKRLDLFVVLPGVHGRRRLLGGRGRFADQRCGQSHKCDRDARTFPRAESACLPALQPGLRMSHRCDPFLRWQEGGRAIRTSQLEIVSEIFDKHERKSERNLVERKERS